MKKKEYIKPEISLVEMMENISILAGSYGDTVKIDFEDDLEDSDDNNGFGSGEGTGVWD